jgi:hypothetical protein
MSTTTYRKTPPSDGGSVDHRLARLLDSPLLAQVVPHLLPETLHQLIQYRGLDACGELVTRATPAQLTSLLDLDLWRHARPGLDEQFDVDRFGDWLEVLVDTGDSVAARTVAALDAHLVILGLSRYLRVFDPGTFEPIAQSDDEPIDRHDLMNFETSRDVPECEIGGYLLRARRTDAWDAIVALLVTLEIEHHDYFHTVMRGCHPLSNSRPEIDGLDDLLMAPEQHLHDVAIERDQRRSRQGYATPADARAFLQTARQSRGASAPGASNPITAAYFRAADEETDPSASAASKDAGKGATPAGAPDSAHDDTVPTTVDALVELLAEAGMAPERPRALLAAANEDPQTARLSFLKELMDRAQRHDENAYHARSRELAFLANTLLAGCSVQSRPCMPGEASDAAACICNLGLECAAADGDLVTAFEMGWSVLYREVSLFAADQLISTLSDLRGADADTRHELRTLRRRLLAERGAGTPWLARDAADVLAVLDSTAWISVIGLLDECPILPAALTAILEGSTTLVNPTAFDFISTRAQLGDVRAFLKALPGLLSR